MSEKVRTVSVEIEPHFAGKYHIRYDGKYITLFGCDNRYPIHNIMQEGSPFTGEYEEMVLVPIVEEIRNASPFIQEVTDKEVVICLYDI